MADSVEITTSSSYNSFSPHSGGVLEINMDLLPRYNPPRNPIASPSRSICSPYVSNGLHSRISDPNTTSQLGPKFGNTRLSNVIINLEKMLNDREWDYSDADIVVDGNSVGVNRFVLASTCPFFHQFFSKERPTGEGRPIFYMSELVPAGMVGYEAFLLILGYLYSGNLKAYTHEVSTCVDDSCSHEICFPAIDFQLQLLYASATFQIDELVSLLQRHLLDILNEVVIDDILVILSVANMCGKDCRRLIEKCIELVVKSDVDLATLDKALPQEIAKQIVDLRLELGSDGTSFPDKHNRIHRALDSGHVNLVRMLFEGHTNLLDDAHALHYAVAFCDSKTTRELLDLALADVNSRNSRGYTVLHVAARRKDPQIIDSLLLKGARVSDLTPDCRQALQIAKRTTRAADYYKNTEEGKHASKERLCIELLKQAERINPSLGDVFNSIALEGDDQQMNLLSLYLDIPEDWWERCSHPDFPEDEFRSVFRMSKATFNFLCEELDSVTMLHEAIPSKQCVAVCIWMLATGEPLRLVSKRFGLGISTCHKLVLDVCTAIKTVLMPKLIEWPEGEKMDRIKREYETISGIKNIGGSIYTTHVPIVAPKISATAYFNKRHTERNQKTAYTITVQGVTDCRGIFTDVCIGWPGSMPDDQVLEKSALFQRANRGLLKDVWIVGNSGYPLMDWVLVPYNHQRLTWTQHGFNEKVSDVQRVSKDAFARLKGRWGCFQMRTEMKVQDLPVVLGACCVVHNICELRNEEMRSEWSFEIFDDEMVAENCVRSASALQARDHIAYDLLHLAGASFL